MLDTVTLKGTTDGSGNATITSDVRIVGHLDSIEWIQGTLAATTDATFSLVREGGAADLTLLTLTDASASAVYRPRYPIHTNAGAAITDGSKYDLHFLNGRLKLAIAQGGASAPVLAIVHYRKE